MAAAARVAVAAAGVMVVVAAVVVAAVARSLVAVVARSLAAVRSLAAATPTPRSLVVVVARSLGAVVAVAAKPGARRRRWRGNAAPCPSSTEQRPGGDAGSTHVARVGLYPIATF